MRVDDPASEFVNCSVLLGEPQGNDAQRPIDIQPGLHRPLPKTHNAGKHRESNAL
jgi:hypothetical protein